MYQNCHICQQNKLKCNQYAGKHIQTLSDVNNVTLVILVNGHVIMIYMNKLPTDGASSVNDIMLKNRHLFY